jgi:hypothetical protein
MLFYGLEGAPELKLLTRARPLVLEFLEVSLDDFVSLGKNKQEDLAFEKLKALAELKDKLQGELGESHEQTVQVKKKLRTCYDLCASVRLIKHSGYGQFFPKPRS